MPTMPSQIPPKISAIPCHALSQSPVKTPTTKSITPPSDLKIPPITSDSISKAFNTISPNLSNIGAIIGKIF